MFPSSDDWTLKEPPQISSTIKGPGIMNTTVRSLEITRCKGSGKVVSLIFDTGSTGHLINVKVSSNSKFCEIYAMSSNSETYLATCRGELDEMSFYEHSYTGLCFILIIPVLMAITGQKTFFSKLHLKFLSLQGNKDELTVPSISIMYTQMASMSSSALSGESNAFPNMRPSNIVADADDKGSVAATGLPMMGLSGTLMEQMRADMMREIANIVEEKMQPVVSQVCFMERRLSALESQNARILDALSLILGSVRAQAAAGAGEEDVAAPANAGGRCGEPGRVVSGRAEHVLPHENVANAGAMTGNNVVAYEDCPNECDDSISAVPVSLCEGEDGECTGEGAGLKSDMKHLMLLLRRDDSLR
jgi:hypothetical protein